MFLFKCIHKVMIEQFAFLLDYGFTLKKLQKGGDLELYYTKAKVSIGAWYYYGINDSYEKHYTFDVIIKENNERERLFNCHHIFDKQDLIDLEKSIMDQKTKEQIYMYAAFIKKNIEKINSRTL